MVLAVLIGLATGSPGAPAEGGRAAASTTRPTPGGTSATPTPTASSTGSTGGSSDTGAGVEFPSSVVLEAPTSTVPAELARFYGAKIAWAPCPGSKRDRCGSVRVPVDYAHPDGATVRIALRKVPATKPSMRKGTLFINPGGPGASGIEFARHASSFFSTRVRDVWDVVGFDPRGIGESGGFPCLRTKDLDAMYAADPTPDTAAERAALLKGRTDRVEGCLRRGGELARNMGTENVARDLDILRDAVGDTHLNYVGISYGTLLGALYGKRFPDRIGLMVIDSAVNPDVFAAAGATQQQVDDWASSDADGVDQTFDEFFDHCAKSGDCPLGSDRTTAARRLVSFLDGLDRHPLPSDAMGIPRLTEGWAVTALGAVLQFPDSYDDMEGALSSAIDEGDGTGLVWMAMNTVDRADDGTYGGYEVSHLAVRCADWPYDPTEDMQPSRSVLDKHPLYAHLAGSWADSCKGWKGTVRSDLVVLVDAKTPVLVIGNLDDPTTPIFGTRRMARAIQNSALVTVDAQGHGAYSAGNHCIDRVVDDYLVDDLVPAPSTICAKE
ncbi:alpha/beta hydrolase [Intrasporangium oryzae NRRL B-24470]|uniref:Alpha/beta hydrolase n=1 Tax=Intrasporangium oryzae NRRL B-24470 TaxID=1386089 RepID=W9GBN5_9MICO|nr:alpha/beta hydrolase [Intrasporangium oryzae NRRL B-24470]